MGKSFQLLRTNPRLTTNVKLVVSSDYNLYLESFDSSKELNDDKYKHYLLSTDAMLENDIPKFYDSLPKKIAFSPKTENDVDVMYDTYDNQFDETYFSGSDEIEDTWYTEEFEYFAPLYTIKNELPSNFIIMRIDDPNIYVKNGSDYDIGTLSKDNFRSEIIDKWKCASVFDLSNNTSIGKFFDRNINDNDRFPDFSFFFDTKKYNYSKWSGLEYKTGVYRTAELFLDDKLYYENPHFNLEEFVTKGFEENGIIYPYVLNLKYLFDDNPATPDEFLKYSMNRYYGFYTQSLDLVKTITSYEFPELKDNLTITNNIFLDGVGEHVNPFKNEYIKNDWVQIDNEFYEIRQQTNGAFKIISDKNITVGVSNFNKGQVLIAGNSITDFGTIDQYISSENEDENMYADLYLIEINGIYHVLKNDYTKSTGNSGETIFTNNYTIQTDYSISSNADVLEYYKGGRDSEYYNINEVSDKDTGPLYYSIYRVKLSDVKDFDFDRIHTSYSDFDYEKSTYVDTLEQKLHAVEYRDNSQPKRKKLHTLNQDGQYYPMNISSEYTAGDETFELRSKDKINPLWEKNQSICKWGYRGSISHSDYPYKLNNSNEIGGTYNRTTNTVLKTANVKEKNLDYFYRIGNFFGTDDIPFVDNFDNGFGSKWNVDSGSWNYITSGGGYLQGEISTPNSVLSNTDITLELGKNYYVYMRIRIYSGNDESGIDPTSFDNMTSSLQGTNVVIEGIRKANSDTLKIFSGENSQTRFYELYVYELTERYYLNQSTNIQTNLFSYLDTSTDNRFDLNYYINSDFDYFDFFFRNNMYYEDYGKLKEKPYLKYSTFGGGDDTLPATALFNGVEYKIYNVQDIVLDSPAGTEESIRNIITDGGNNFNGYKIATILSENYNYYSFDKSEVTVIEEDIISSDYGNMSDIVVANESRYNAARDDNGSLEWQWVPQFTIPTILTFRINDPDINLIDTYDIEITIEWGVDGFDNTNITTQAYMYSNTSFVNLSEQIFDESYIGGNNNSGVVVTTLTDEHSLTAGYFQIELNVNLDDTITSSSSGNYIKIIGIKIDKKEKTTEYNNPQFEYSYNTSVNGILDGQDKNGIHVYLNEKYKNALIVINQNIPINSDWVSLNNIDAFGENYGLYYGKTLDGFNLFPVTGTTTVDYNPDNITAFNYINAMNNLNTKGLFDSYIHYHYIDEDGNYAKTQMIKFGNSTFEDLPNWDEKFPPFIIEVDEPLELKLKKKSYTRRTLDKPNTNINYKFLVFDNGVLLPQSIIDEPLSRHIQINDKNERQTQIYHGESIIDYNTIKRFVGYYEPLFKTIPMYRPVYYWKDGDEYKSVGDNYVFADNLEQFATIDELMYSKVNDEENVLKLQDNDNDRSVYPMVDEIGLSQTERFIFLSSWDSNFFIKTLDETTFLEEFITTDLEDPTIPVYGQLTNISVITPSNYISGLNIYGNTLDSGDLDFDITIKNLGLSAQVYSYQMKYVSNLGSTGILEQGTTPSLTANSSTTVSISHTKPTEQNFGVTYYEEFTTWKVIFEILDSDNNELDSNDNTTFDVYNNLIDFTLSNPQVSDGFTSSHYVNNTYDYSIDLTETNNRLKNITYVANLYMETSGGTDVYELMSSINGTMTKNKTLEFKDINTPIYDLDYDSTDVRKMKYEVYHEYEIEGLIQTTGSTVIETPGVTVVREVEPAFLTWKYPTSEPNYVMGQGTCNYVSGIYNGDYVDGCSATIENIGGPFNGTIKVTFYWRADSLTIGTTIGTWSGALNKNDVITITSDSIEAHDIGPININTSEPYVTYTSKDYTIKAISNQISGSITTTPIVGYYDTYPDCIL